MHLYRLLTLDGWSPTGAALERQQRVIGPLRQLKERFERSPFIPRPRTMDIRSKSAIS